MTTAAPRDTLTIAAICRQRALSISSSLSTGALIPRLVHLQEKNDEGGVPDDSSRLADIAQAMTEVKIYPELTQSVSPDTKTPGVIAAAMPHAQDSTHDKMTHARAANETLRKLHSTNVEAVLCHKLLHMVGSKQLHSKTVYMNLVHHNKYLARTLQGSVDKLASLPENDADSSASDKLDDKLLDHKLTTADVVRGHHSFAFLGLYLQACRMQHHAQQAASHAPSAGHTVPIEDSGFSLPPRMWENVKQVICTLDLGKVFCIEKFDDIKIATPTAMLLLQAAFVSKLGDHNCLQEVFLPLVHLINIRGEAEAQTKFLLALAVGAPAGETQMMQKAFSSGHIRAVTRIPATLLSSTVALFHHDTAGITTAAQYFQSELRVSNEILTGMLAAVKHMPDALGVLPSLMGIPPNLASALVAVTNYSSQPRKLRQIGALAVLMDIQQLLAIDNLVDILHGKPQCVTQLDWEKQVEEESHELLLADAIAATAAGRHMQDHQLVAIIQQLVRHVHPPLRADEMQEQSSSHFAVFNPSPGHHDHNTPSPARPDAQLDTDEDKRGQQAQMRLQHGISLMIQLGRGDTHAAKELILELIALDSSRWDFWGALVEDVSVYPDDLDTHTRTSMPSAAPQPDISDSNNACFQTGSSGGPLQSTEFARYDSVTNQDCLGSASQDRQPYQEPITPMETSHSRGVYKQLPPREELSQLEEMSSRVLLVVEYVLRNAHEFHEPNADRKASYPMFNNCQSFFMDVATCFGRVEYSQLQPEAAWVFPGVTMFSRMMLLSAAIVLPDTYMLLIPAVEGRLDVNDDSPEHEPSSESAAKMSLQAGKSLVVGTIALACGDWKVLTKYGDTLLRELCLTRNESKDVSMSSTGQVRLTQTQSLTSTVKALELLWLLVRGDCSKAAGAFAGGVEPRTSLRALLLKALSNEQYCDNVLTLHRLATLDRNDLSHTHRWKVMSGITNLHSLRRSLFRNHDMHSRDETKICQTLQMLLMLAAGGRGAMGIADLEAMAEHLGVATEGASRNFAGCVRLAGRDPDLSPVDLEGLTGIGLDSESILHFTRAMQGRRSSLTELASQLAKLTGEEGAENIFDRAIEDVKKAVQDTLEPMGVLGTVLGTVIRCIINLVLMILRNIGYIATMGTEQTKKFARQLTARSQSADSEADEVERFLERMERLFAVAQGDVRGTLGTLKNLLQERENLLQERKTLLQERRDTIEIEVWNILEGYQSLVAGYGPGALRCLPKDMQPRDSTLLRTALLLKCQDYASLKHTLPEIAKVLVEDPEIAKVGVEDPANLVTDRLLRAACGQTQASLELASLWANGRQEMDLAFFISALMDPSVTTVSSGSELGQRNINWVKYKHGLEQAMVWFQVPSSVQLHDSKKMLMYTFMRKISRNCAGVELASIQQRLLDSIFSLDQRPMVQELTDLTYFGKCRMDHVLEHLMKAPAQPYPTLSPPTLAVLIRPNVCAHGPALNHLMDITKVRSAIIIKYWIVNKNGTEATWQRAYGISLKSSAVCSQRRPATAKNPTFDTETSTESSRQEEVAPAESIRGPANLIQEREVGFIQAEVTDYHAESSKLEPRKEDTKAKQTLVKKWQIMTTMFTCFENPEHSSLKDLMSLTLRLLVEPEQGAEYIKELSEEMRDFFEALLSGKLLKETALEKVLPWLVKIDKDELHKVKVWIAFILHMKLEDDHNPEHELEQLRQMSKIMIEMAQLKLTEADMEGFLQLVVAVGRQDVQRSLKAMNSLDHVMPNQVQLLIQLLEGLGALQMSQGSDRVGKDGAGTEAGGEAKGRGLKNSFEVLFSQLDVDGCGEIPTSNLNNLLVSMKLNLTDERRMELLSLADGGTGVIKLEGMTEAVKVVAKELAEDCMRILNVSWDFLILGFVSAISYLTLIMIFLFLGIKAFSTTSTFSSIVESMCAAGAGVGSSVKGAIQDAKAEKFDIMETVKKAWSRLTLDDNESSDAKVIQSQ
ncbi:hypothetical protein CYMTET_52643 [Cymbomonas tetramitiformis]|uniref:Uncharacterized protein n=1 Tax=Cymbomonas tetramitiformis TaxID=36881 RepID=A0AAE0EQW1_9CHLO|nr:hypothetical protein CYMTET_52643 [Cymbomonas tetramitiformis]